jgi:hypothetical protein
MNNLIKMLQQLSELDPATCRPMEGNGYEIGIYRFFLDTNGELHGYAFGSMHNSCTGRPALAWLRDAVEAACEARGWNVDAKTYQQQNHVRISNHSGLEAFSNWHKDSADALLAAFVEAVRVERGER